MPLGGGIEPCGRYESSRRHVCSFVSVPCEPPAVPPTPPRGAAPIPPRGAAHPTSRCQAPTSRCRPAHLEVEHPTVQPPQPSSLARPHAAPVLAAAAVTRRVLQARGSNLMIRCATKSRDARAPASPPRARTALAPVIEQAGRRTGGRVSGSAVGQSGVQRRGGRLERCHMACRQPWWSSRRAALLGTCKHASQPRPATHPLHNPLHQQGVLTHAPEAAQAHPLPQRRQPCPRRQVVVLVGLCMGQQHQVVYRGGLGGVLQGVNVQGGGKAVSASSRGLEVCCGCSTGGRHAGVLHVSTSAAAWVGGSSGSGLQGGSCPPPQQPRPARASPSA